MDPKKMLRDCHSCVIVFMGKYKQEDHDGPISHTWVLSSIGRQSYVPTCDPRGRANFDPRGNKWTNLIEVH